MSFSRLALALAPFVALSAPNAGARDGGAAASPADAGAPAAASSSAASGPWTALEPGLDLGEVDGPPTDAGDGKVRLLRLDPARFDLRLLTAKADDGVARSARAWAERAGAVAAVNASMYQEDYRTSVSLMRSGKLVVNPRVTKDNAVLAFDPSDPALPRVDIIDRTCQDFPGLMPRYGGLVQSIRLVSCEGVPTWEPQSRRFSIAAIGLDRAGRVLFIHSRTPYPVRDLTERLLALPIGLKRAMYVEGGPEAQLFVRAGGREIESLGLTGALPETADGRSGWPVPNVVAAVRRGPSRPAR